MGTKRIDRSTLTYAGVLKICNQVNSTYTAEKRRQIANAWVGGNRSVRKVREVLGGGSPHAINKFTRALKDAEKAVIADPGINDPAPAKPPEPVPEAPKPDSPPATQFEAPADLKPVILETDSEGNPVITGPTYIAMLESLMLSAHKDGRVRDFKDLSTVRNAIVDVAGQLPQTDVDIERTLGLEGLAGMDRVLSETIAQFTDHWHAFPYLWETLCAMFNRDPITYEPVKPTSPELAETGQNAHESTHPTKPEQPDLPDPPVPESGGGEQTVNSGED